MIINNTTITTIELDEYRIKQFMFLIATTLLSIGEENLLSVQNSITLSILFGTIPICKDIREYPIQDWLMSHSIESINKGLEIWNAR